MSSKKKKETKKEDSIREKKIALNEGSFFSLSPKASLTPLLRLQNLSSKSTD